MKRPSTSYDVNAAERRAAVRRANRDARARRRFEREILPVMVAGCQCSCHKGDGIAHPGKRCECKRPGR